MNSHNNTDTPRSDADPREGGDVYTRQPDPRVQEGEVRPTSGTRLHEQEPDGSYQE